MDALFHSEAVVRDTTNEWFTPARYIEAARETMGGIDLDSASCEMANRTVKATRYYTQEDNGLTHDWIAERVWLNPPFGRKNAGKNSAGARTFGGGRSLVVEFVSKLISEYEAGHIKQAILLCTADTDAKWFYPLWKYPICFADHRVLFDRPNLPRQGQFFGTCFVYLGPNESKFVETFSQFGPVITPDGVHRKASEEQAMQPQLWTA